jgi:hypothetical protein
MFKRIMKYGKWFVILYVAQACRRRHRPLFGVERIDRLRPRPDPLTWGHRPIVPKWNRLRHQPVEAGPCRCSPSQRKRTPRRCRVPPAGSPVGGFFALSRARTPPTGCWPASRPPPTARAHADLRPLRPFRGRARPIADSAGASWRRRLRCSAPCAGRPGDRGRRDTGRRRAQNASAAGEQLLGGLPGRNMDHVDTQDGIGVIDGPLRPAHVEVERRQHVRQARLGQPAGDRRAHLRIGFARLPGQAGSALAKCTTCWPVPLAISSTRPDCGSTRWSTARIGSLLRSAAGADCRAQSSSRSPCRRCHSSSEWG